MSSLGGLLRRKFAERHAPGAADRIVGGWLIVFACLLIAASSWVGAGPAGLCVMGAAILVLVVQIAWQDAATMTISDEAVATLAIAGFAGAGAEEPGLPALAVACLHGVLGGGSVWLVREAYFRRRGFDGLGFGDVKLAAAGGVLVGIEGLSLAVLGASLAGLGFVALDRVVRGSVGLRGTDRIPFGVFLGPALGLVWLGRGIERFGALT